MMAGYSGKTLAEKLGIKTGMAVAAVGAPPNYRRLLGTVPADVNFCASNAQAHLIHYFCTERARLMKELPALRRKMRDAALFWVSWPKKSAGVHTDVTEDVVRTVALPLGLVDTKVCAVDNTWSALRLVIRRSNRRSAANIA